MITRLTVVDLYLHSCLINNNIKVTKKCTSLIVSLNEYVQNDNTSKVINILYYQFHMTERHLNLS